MMGGFMTAKRWRVAVTPREGGKVIYYPPGRRRSAAKLLKALTDYYGDDAESLELEPVP